jgi:AcrR family transcriptional regulator
MPRRPPRAAATVAEPAPDTADGRSRGERTRDRLLEAGAAVFADRGLHAARVDDIVKGARTSHGTFYLYFANKEALFQALAAQVADELETVASRLPALTPGPAGVAALAAWMQDFADVYARSGPVIRAWTEAEMVATDAGQLGTDVWGSFTAAMIRRIHEAGVDGLDPGVAALALVAMLERANYYQLTGQVPVEDTQLPTTLARAAVAAVFG